MSVLEIGMNQELTVNLGDTRSTVFLQNGFYLITDTSSHMHKHNYTEMHVFSGGDADVNIDGRIHKLSSGEVLCIPAGHLHIISLNESTTVHTAFQIELPTSSIETHSFANEIVTAFFEEIKKCRFSQDYTEVSAFISLLCSDFYPEHRISAHNVKDSSFIINEFFSNNYGSDVTLFTLAQTLHLSKKQTERLVIKTMGCTFKKALTNVRMATADHLVKTTDMPMTEVAEYVGYRSYSGFWKAYSKHKSK